MPVIAVTGHMNLSSQSVELVRAAIESALRSYDPADLVGVSCVARGADSIFAQCVLRAGGKLRVILPSLDYREAKVKPDHLEQFDELVAGASEVLTLPFENANRDAYEAANAVLLDTADVLFAVWDGGGAVDKGSTASVVQSARDASLTVEIIWPEGATRS